ncbi:MAG: anti-sigma factor [Methyloceanibacter sp.]|nr:anti-sigma factor [Methyloceanibacter sp.]
MSPSEDDELLLNAYLDGELNPIEARAFEQQLARDPALTRGVEARSALRTALRSDLAEDLPSSDLRRRILQRLNLRTASPTRSWSALVASFLMGAVVAGGLTFGVVGHRSGDDIAGQVVSAHIRSLMAPQATDVVSSDHHTVKPWFNGKIAFPPTVADLGSVGFPLVGARIDVVGLEPVASLVYSHGKHLISLTEIPNAEVVPALLTTRFERGYVAFSWSDGGITYWAVSDMAADELRSFVDLVRAAIRS